MLRGVAPAASVGNVLAVGLKERRNYSTRSSDLRERWPGVCPSEMSYDKGIGICLHTDFPGRFAPHGCDR